MNYQEKRVDLFDISKPFVYAHCISEDCAMGAGIAVQFDKRNRGMRRFLLEQKPTIGQAVGYKNPASGQLTYNLITKKTYWQKPTYESFQKTILALRDEMGENNQKYLAIPLLGAGLDRLSWGKNRDIIHQAFKDTDISILVCKQ